MDGYTGSDGGHCNLSDLATWVGLAGNPHIITWQGWSGYPFGPQMASQFRLFSSNYLADIPEIIDLSKAIKAPCPAIDCVLKGEGEPKVPPSPCRIPARRSLQLPVRPVRSDLSGHTIAFFAAACRLITFLVTCYFSRGAPPAVVNAFAAIVPFGGAAFFLAAFLGVAFWATPFFAATFFAPTFFAASRAEPSWRTTSSAPSSPDSRSRYMAGCGPSVVLREHRWEKSFQLSQLHSLPCL
ncbi:hypothetical protein B0G80_6026 [Paraburkholderia sp. BL6669N2]|nr:hypothetical protein B0G80_6026 [Paraburkholderia sp. BL6669N2]